MESGCTTCIDTSVLLPLAAGNRVSSLTFEKITPDAMDIVWHYLQREQGCTTDFSYGGMLMWVDFFEYSYCITGDTLFIKGKVEDNRTKTAFSLPVGSMSITDSIGLLKEYCFREGITLELSAVPEYALDMLRAQNPSKVEELTDWADYLYDIVPLASLTGKKMAKKRNHVNRFINLYHDWRVERLTPENVSSAFCLLDVYERENVDSEMSAVESEMTRKMLHIIGCRDTPEEGMILFNGSEPCAFTIGDVKGDTLFVHIEKALRTVEGSYEMINNQFAQAMRTAYPELRYINREDDGGDEGLRRAKQSYHPVAMLRKYNVVF